VKQQLQSKSCNSSLVIGYVKFYLVVWKITVQGKFKCSSSWCHE